MKRISKLLVLVVFLAVGGVLFFASFNRTEAATFTCSGTTCTATAYHVSVSVNSSNIQSGTLTLTNGGYAQIYVSGGPNMYSPSCFVSTSLPNVCNYTASASGDSNLRVLNPSSANGTSAGGSLNTSVYGAVSSNGTRTGNLSVSFQFTDKNGTYSVSADLPYKINPFVPHDAPLRTNDTHTIRIARGAVDSSGNILTGSGFTVMPVVAGRYQVFFYGSPFTAEVSGDVPIVHSSLSGSTVGYVSVGNQATTEFDVYTSKQVMNDTACPPGSDTGASYAANIPFSFFAVGHQSDTAYEVENAEGSKMLVVRGSLGWDSNGNLLVRGGEGFIATSASTGNYQVNFLRQFSATPVVVLGDNSANFYTENVSSPSKSGFTIRAYKRNCNLSNVPVSFVAIGPATTAISAPVFSEESAPLKILYGNLNSSGAVVPFGYSGYGLTGGSTGAGSYSIYYSTTDPFMTPRVAALFGNTGGPYWVSATNGSVTSAGGNTWTPSGYGTSESTAFIGLGPIALPTLSASLSASPTSVTVGSHFTLTWSASPSWAAASCTGSTDSSSPPGSNWSTSNTGGSATITPTGAGTAKYSYACTDWWGNTTTPTQTATVTVSGGAALSVSPTTVTATAAFGGSAVTVSSAVTVKNTGSSGTTLAWSAAVPASAGWLTLSSLNGSLSAGQSKGIDFSFNPSGLPAGTQTATVTFNCSGGCSGSGATVNVILTVSGGVITVSSVSSVDGSAVPATWDFPSYPANSNPCSSAYCYPSGSGSYQANSTYSNMSVGPYTVDAPYNNEWPANFALRGIKKVYALSSALGDFEGLAGWFLKPSAFETALAFQPCTGTFSSLSCPVSTQSIDDATAINGGSIGWTLTWDPLAVMNLSGNSVSLTATPGGTASQQITVSNTGANGSTLNWNTSVSYGSGSGWLSVSPASGALAAGNSQSATFTADASKVPSAGTYTATVTFAATQSPSSRSISPQSVTVTLTVQDFTLSVSPSNVSVIQGQQGSFTVTASDVGGVSFSSSIALSLAWNSDTAPGGVTYSFSPQSITTGSGGSTLTFLVDGPSSSPGQYNFTVTGTGGGVTHTAQGTLTVIPPQVTCSTFTATPVKIIYSPPQIGSSTLSWSCTNADSCTVINSNTGNTMGSFSGSSGSTVVSPVFTTTYTVVCSKYAGSSTPIQTTVTVLSPGIQEQ